MNRNGNTYNKVIRNGITYNKAYKNGVQIMGSSAITSILDGAELYLPMDSPDGRMTNYNSPTYVAGKKLNAMSYNGSSQYSTLNGYDIQSDSISLGCWLYLRSLPKNHGGIIGKSVAGGVSGRYCISSNLKGANNIIIVLQLGANVYVFTDPTNINEYVGKWTHLVMTVDKVTLKTKLFVNAVEKISGDIVSYSNIISGTKFFIANYGDATGQNPTPYFINGNIDDIFFMRKALTSTEILQLYNEYF